MKFIDTHYFIDNLSYLSVKIQVSLNLKPFKYCQSISYYILLNIIRTNRKINKRSY